MAAAVKWIGKMVGILGMRWALVRGLFLLRQSYCYALRLLHELLFTADNTGRPAELRRLSHFRATPLQPPAL
jgi:hypothetical protein